VEMAQAQGEIPASIVASDLVIQLWTMSDGLAVARMSHPTEFTAETVERLWSDAFDRLVGS